MRLLRVGGLLRLLAVLQLHRRVEVIHLHRVAGAEGRPHLERGAVRHPQFHGRALHQHHPRLVEEVATTPLLAVAEILHVVEMILRAAERVLRVGEMIRHLAVLRVRNLLAVDLTAATHHRLAVPHVMIHRLRLRAVVPPALILHLSVAEVTVRHLEELALAVVVNPHLTGLEMNALAGQRTCLLVDVMSRHNAGGETPRPTDVVIPHLAAVTTRRPADHVHRLLVAHGVTHRHTAAVTILLLRAAVTTLRMTGGVVMDVVDDDHQTKRLSPAFGENVRIGKIV
ncbi:hypothetical protein BDV93DRAFT_517800 [Ceratobasidium sp. AG-I]|nr:hypothetical protein BDV93DRAFT_517800 [Ceratobasidium sp. AG-I]